MSHAHLPIILIANKSDQLEEEASDDQSIMMLSAEEGRRDAAVLEQLIQQMADIVGSDLHLIEGSPVVMNQRHQFHLKRAHEAVLSAQRAMAAQASGDTLALDLRVALHELGNITGEITNEDVLDQIFSRFCIGK